MKQTQIIMGMPITVEIVDRSDPSILDQVFDYFKSIDERFSTYKSTSEISQINRGELRPEEYSQDMKTIFAESEITKKLTKGFFDIQRPDGQRDPSGLVKGWAIQHAAKLLQDHDLKNFYVEAGGDTQVRGTNIQGQPWRVGLKNPFNQKEIVKVVYVRTQGVATSGTYMRGQHIYNPHQPEQKIHDIVSVTVIGPNIYEADRFATAAFTMGRPGINFLEKQNGLSAYMIDSEGIATQTSGFEKYLKPE